MDAGQRRSSRNVPVEAVTIPKPWAGLGPRYAIAADVVSDGRYLGETTEAVVEMEG